MSWVGGGPLTSPCGAGEGPGTWVLLFVFFGLALPDPAGAHGLEASGGIHTNFGAKHRRIFGSAFAASLGYSAPLGPHDAHLIVEVGYARASGEEFAQDPTFEEPETTYWFIPITLGMRTNLVSDRYEGPIGVYLGLGLLTFLSGLENPDGQSSTAPTWGAMMELRPQVRISRGLAIWVRERVSIVADLEYAHRPQQINLSGTSLQLGLCVTGP